MKAKTKRKLERVVMLLLVIVFLLGWTLLLYLPKNAGPTPPPVKPTFQAVQVQPSGAAAPATVQSPGP